MSKESRIGLIFSLALLTLSGCSEPACPPPIKNGTIVEGVLNGEKYVITNGDPFTNINTGSCSVMVSTKSNKNGPISIYAVKQEVSKEFQID